MKNAYELIIFDWDGTLIDSIDWITHCLQKAGTLCGFAHPEDQTTKNTIGLSIDNALKALYPEADAATVKHMIHHYSTEYFSKKIAPTDLFDGVYDMLEQLKADGYQLAVATGKTRNGLNEALAGTGTEHLFCTTRCADETASKPHPRMLNEIIAHTQIAKDRVLMVGDSIHDLEMAKNADIAAIGVVCGAHSEAHLQPYNPLRCLQLPTQLLEFI